MSARLSSAAGSSAWAGARAIPERAGHLDLQPVEGDRLLEGLQDPPADPQHPRLVGGVRQQDGELVTAEPGHRAGLPDRGGQPRPDLGQEQVALLVPEGLVDLLEVVEVEDHDGRALGPAVGDVVQGRGQAAPQVLAVRQPGERVVQGLVAQLTHELAVAQRDAGLVRDGLQQEDVVLVEAADVPDPVGHDQRADDAGLAAQRHHDRVAHAVAGQPPARLGVPGAAGHEQRRPLGHHLPEHPGVLGAGRVLGPGEAPAGPEPHAGDDAAVGGHERRRGPLGTQQFPRLRRAVRSSPPRPRGRCSPPG